VAVSGSHLVDLLLMPKDVDLRPSAWVEGSKQPIDNEMPVSVTTGMSLDELGLTMFQTFARMEYALKAAGYHQGDGDAKPDWDRLGRECDTYLREHVSPDLRAAIEYILEEPPQKQVIEKGQLEWKQVLAHGQTQGEQLLVYVRRVRNNLFHGGKFNGHWFTPERNEPLLRHSLAVLCACLEACPVINGAFRQE
jgi:hypothetical protein